MAQRRKRLLSTEVILDASLASIDATGRLTMADLAERLGVSASSIYHHLPGRAAIIEALRERLVAVIDPPPLDGSDWGGQISRWMRDYRRAFAAHPNLIPLVNEQTMTGGAALLGYEQVATLLRSAGVPVSEVVLWISVLDAYALGSALDLAAPDDVWCVDRDDLPVLTEAIRAAPAGRKRADEAFVVGLEALIASLRHRLSV